MILSFGLRAFIVEYVCEFTGLELGKANKAVVWEGGLEGGESMTGIYFRGKES